MPLPPPRLAPVTSETVPKRGPSGMLGHPAHRISRAEVVDSGVDERAADQCPTVGGERQHVSDHPRVREDLRRVADRVDERLLEPAFLGDRAYFAQERRTG